MSEPHPTVEGLQKRLRELREKLEKTPPPVLCELRTEILFATPEIQSLFEDWLEREGAPAFEEWASRHETKCHLVAGEWRFDEGPFPET